MGSITIPQPTAVRKELATLRFQPVACMILSNVAPSSRRRSSMSWRALCGVAERVAEVGELVVEHQSGFVGGFRFEISLVIEFSWPVALAGTAVGSGRGRDRRGRQPGGTVLWSC